MVLIDNLSDAADQQTALQLSDGSTAILELIYRGSTKRWTYSFTHSAFPNGADNGQMLCVHPNILRNFKHLIPFGLSVVSTDGGDPVSIEDFASGRIKLYLLDAADVAFVESTFYGINA